MDVLERDIEKCNLNIDNSTLLIKNIIQENKENKMNIDVMIIEINGKKLKIKIRTQMNHQVGMKVIRQKVKKMKKRYFSVRQIKTGNPM